MRRGSAAAVLVAGMLSAGCGEFVRRSQSPSQLVIVRLETPAVEFVKLEGGSGVPGKLERISGFGPAPLYSNVAEVTQDAGRVVLRQILRDPGMPGAAAAPTPLNDVTVTEYEVRYRLANGRNAPGVDVPHPIRGGLTFTIQGSNTATSEFELVRRVAKLEPPLAALKGSKVVLTVVADVTFYGHDQAGNAVSTTGSVQINFLDFAG
ncbi:MAG: hypothetical protein HY655_12915 [Acidobacteria bacterium]|nr:hypothetical protein [Acidobacteriota bacterium]